MTRAPLPTVFTNLAEPSNALLTSRLPLMNTHQNKAKETLLTNLPAAHSAIFVRVQLLN